MTQKVTGNINSLPPSALKRVEKLYHRRIDSDEIVPFEFARELCSIASDLRRRIGALISREGIVEEVFLGTKDILYLPDLGRYRLGQGRLRRLRLVFSDLSNNPKVTIPPDIYGDLEKLRLDAVVAIKAPQNKIIGAYAYLLPQSGTRTEQISDLSLLELDFDQFIEGLEDELSSAAQTETTGGALLIGVYEKTQSAADESIMELSELARTASLPICGKIIQRRSPDPKTLLGKGKLEEVILQAIRTGAEMLIFDCELRPSQWRAITNATDLKVIDRSMLILDIFAQRATTSEGRLQVELAQLKYNLPRLVEKDAGLSRLTGGIGGRGPGETKLELGRRRIRDRITFLEGKIAEIGKQRAVRRARRQEKEIPVVAIVGYTNVGKSTLFNALTQGNVLVENKLFATLDTSQRKLYLPPPSGDEKPLDAILTDTVGFIRELPDELVTAFKATLEELSQAHLLIHLLDISDPGISDRYRAVRSILKEMGFGEIPEMIVLNKCDTVNQAEIEARSKEFNGIPVSALSQKNFLDLKKALYRAISQNVDFSVSKTEQLSEPFSF